MCISRSSQPLLKFFYSSIFWLPHPSRRHLVLLFHSSSHHFPLVYPALHPSIFISKIHPSTLFCFHSFYSAITFIHPYFLSIQLFIYFFLIPLKVIHPWFSTTKFIHPSVPSWTLSLPFIQSISVSTIHPSFSSFHPSIIFQNSQIGPFTHPSILFSLLLVNASS